MQDLDYQLPFDSNDRHIGKIIAGKYIFQKRLGEGCFGYVYKAYNSVNKKHYAVKMIPIKNMNDDRKVTNLHRQIIALQCLNSPYIIKLKQFFKSKTSYYLVLQYCNGGDLASILNKNKENIELTDRSSYVSEKIGCIIIQQICKGMIDLFQQGFVHRDIKLANILVHFNDQGQFNLLNAQIKIGDLGFCRAVQQNNLPNSIVGTPITMAPQMLLQQKAYNQSLDVWSLGVITFQLLTGFLPFIANQINQFLQKIQDGAVKVSRDIKLSRPCLHFINKCLQLDPRNRIQFKNLNQHEWFQVIDYDLDQHEIMLKSSKQATGESYMKMSILNSDDSKQDEIVLDCKNMQKFDQEFKKQFMELNNKCMDELNKNQKQVQVLQSFLIVDPDSSCQNFEPRQSRYSLKKGSMNTAQKIYRDKKMKKQKK